MATVVKARHENAVKPWTVRYMIGTKTKEKSFTTKREAGDFKLEVELGQRTSSFVDPSRGKTDFATYVSSWIERRPVSLSTKSSYRSVLNAHIEPAFCGKTLAQVANDREGMQDLLQVTMPGKVSQSRVNQARSLITGVMDEAVKAGRIASHRLGDIEIGSRDAKPDTFRLTTKDQADTLASGLRADLRLTVDLMRGCGLRISEALAVNIHAFRDSGKMLRVSEQVGRDGKLANLKARGADEHRDVPVPSWVWVKVQTHVSEFSTVDGYLFSRNGQRIRYANYKGGFDSAACKAGLPDFGPHQLRHGFASALLAAGVPITDVAKFLGHKDVNVTYGIYGHLVPDAFDRSRQALEDLDS